LEFLKSTPKGEAILKPLHLFGGQGIQRISLGDWATEEAALAGLTRLLKEYASPVMVQSFHEEVFRGEVRVFTMDGQPLSWCLKVPAQGQFLANTRWGARLEGYHPSPGLRGHMVQVAEEFARKGAYLLGFDVIGEAITEINLTSPRLLQAPEDPTNYYEVLAQWLLEKIKTYNLPQGVLR
jgi:glutathione synthase